jgi:hypothetical protein
MYYGAVLEAKKEIPDHWPMHMKLDLKQAGFTGKVRVRDVWGAKDLGTLEGTYETRVPGHGVVLLRIAQ